MNPWTPDPKSPINKFGSLSITALLHNRVNKRNEIYPGVNAWGIQRRQVKSLSREPHNVLFKKSHYFFYDKKNRALIIFLGRKEHVSVAKSTHE